MATTSSINSLAISGLASGIDTQSIIKQLMDVEKIPVNTLLQRKADLTVKRDAWRDVNTRLSSLSGTLLDLKLSTTYLSKTATSSKDTTITATATSDAINGTYKVKISQLASAQSIASKGTQDFTIPVSGVFTINGQTVNVVNAKSLVDVQNAINNTSNVNATASIVDNRLVIQESKTGSANVLSFGYVSGTDVLKNLQIYDSGTSTITGQILSNALDAKINVNGMDIVRSTNTINDVIQGVTLNLKNITDLASNETISLTVANDTQKATDKIKAFVDQYNSVLDFIGTKLGDDIKKDLSQTSSSTTTQHGDLENDPTLMRVQKSLKSMVSAKIFGSGAYQSLQDIGITTKDSTQALGFSKVGKLAIDTTKLTAALNADPTGVKNLFYGDLNVATPSQGATVIASSEYPGGMYSASSIINGNTSSANWGAGGGWNDNTLGVFPDWVEVDLGSKKTIESVNVFTLDSAAFPAASFGIKDYDIQYWDGTTWQKSLSVTGNKSGMVSSVIPSVTTDKLRIQVNSSNDAQYSRIIQVQAFSHNGVVNDLSNYINSLVQSGTGIVTSKQKGLETTMADIDKQVDAMNRNLSIKEDTLKKQFLAMETAIQKSKSQGSWLTSQIASLPSLSSSSK